VNVNKFIGYILSFFTYTAAILLTICFAMVFIDVVFRYFLNKPIAMVDEVAIILQVAFVFLALVQVERNKGHLNVTFLSDHFRGYVKTIVDIAGTVVTVGVLSYVSWGAYLLIQQNYEAHTRTHTVGIPLWIIYTFIPIGLIFAAFTRITNHFIKDVESDDKDVD